MMKYFAMLSAFIFVAGLASSAEADKKAACLDNCDKKQMSMKRQAVKDKLDEKTARARIRKWQKQCKAKCDKNN